MKSKFFLGFFVLLFINLSGRSQTTIWSENFSTNSNNDFTGNDNNLPSGSDWTTSCPTCNRTNEFRVEGGEFRVENTDEIATWTSELISISGYVNVGATIDVDMNDNQFDATDCITISYILDSDPTTQFPTNGNLCDDGSDPTVASVSGLTGNTIRIIIEAITNETNEDLHFDNIEVFGDVAPGVTGPGGVQAIDGASELQLWLVADTNCYTDAGITQATNNDDIQQWNDLSGFNNHAIQTIGTVKPSLSTNQLNGFSSLTFNDNDERMLAAGLSTSDEATLFVVVRHTSLLNVNDGIIHAAPSGSAFSTSGSSKTIGMWTQVADNQIWGRGVQSNNSIRSLPSNTALSLNQFYVISQNYDGTNISQYVDGTLAGSTTYDGTLNSWTDFGIGRQGNESLNGDIAEIIVHTSSVNSAQKIIIENYLAAKYDLSLTTSDLYDEDDNGNYDFEVAGIGRVDASNIHNDAQGTSIVRILNPTDLGNDEFLIWGHDNGTLSATNSSDIPATIVARFDRVWRVSERNAANSASVDVGSVDLRWDLSSFSSINVADLRLLIDVNNNGNFNDEVPISGATDLGSGIYAFTGVSALADNRRFTLATASTSTPLPIELTSFNARLKSKKVILDWETASELNNDFFTLERSANGKDWEEIIIINGAGNSTVVNSYFHIDFYPLPNISYYRLKQTDFNGEYSYSDVKSINNTNYQGNVSVYPNPVESTIYIEGSDLELSTIRIFNTLGQNITHQLDIASSGQFKAINLSNLNSGIYYVTTLSTSHKLIKE